jgi:Co/Zn/Cd efflux system component
MAACCTGNSSSPSSAPKPDGRYRLILWIALGINLAMFFVEIAVSVSAATR